MSYYKISQLKMNTVYSIRRVNGLEGSYLVLKVGRIKGNIPALMVESNGSLYYIRLEDIASIEFGCIL